MQLEVKDYLEARNAKAQTVFNAAVHAAKELAAKEKSERVAAGGRKVGKASPALVKARADRNRAKAALAQQVGGFNPDSAQQCADYFYGHCGLARRVNRKTKEVTVDDEALAEFARPAYGRQTIPAAETIRKIRELRQVIETFLSWELKKGRFHAAFNLRGTKFGRMSSSKLFFRYGGNQQNIPPAVRACMIADEPYRKK